MLDDAQHIDQVGRFLPGVDALAVLAFQVGIFGVAPHQPQASANGLLQQNLRLRAAQRHDDANVVHVKTFAQHQHAHDHARRGVLVHAEQPFAHGRPVLLAQLGLLARVNGHHLVGVQTFLVLQERSHQRRHRGVLAHHQHLGVARRVDAGKVCLQLAQFFEASPQHYALALTQHGVARLVALGFELQRQCAYLFAPVQHQRLDQPGAHGCLQVKVGDDVRKVQLLLVLAAAHVVVRRGRKVHLHKASALGFGDPAQALLPLHLGHLALALELVNVVRLVVEHHQLRQSGQKLQHVAARIAAVEHVQAVARGAAGR